MNDTTLYEFSERDHQRCRAVISAHEESWQRLLSRHEKSSLLQDQLGWLVTDAIEAERILSAIYPEDK